MRTSSIVAIATILAAVTIPSAHAQRKTVAAPPPAPEIGILPPANIEHGRYLAEHVAMCIECHSTRDSAGRIIDADQYLGGNIPFAPPWPNDWASRAPRNRGLPGYDDKMALRLLTEGAIGRDGRQLRPPMPRFHMTRQDAADVIAFLRSLH
jgi:mono/diheme cytochrome c family protein